MFSEDSSTVREATQAVYKYCKVMLGDGIVDVELGEAELQIALSRALAKYRQRAASSVEESYFFLTLVEDQNTYTLPHEIMEVRQIFRRSIGSRSGNGDGGSIFEPFNLAFTNTYMLNASSMGGLATYDIFAQHQELIGRMFGAYIDFKWNSQTKKLTIMQRPRGSGEELLLLCYNYRPDISILNDMYAGQWIKDYTLATAKYILGQAREKFSSIAGPQGGSSLNGSALKSEATAEIEKLDEELSKQVTGGVGYGFIIG